MRPLICAVCVLCVLFVAACRRQAPQTATGREDAYRANNLGVALLEQFKYPEAAAAFRRSLGVDPSLAVAPIAHVNLSLALLYSQDLAGAAREAAEGARLLPSAPQPPYVLGLIARAENRGADALRFFERVRQLDPQDVGTIVNIGQIYLQDGKYADAITVLRPAVVDEPYNVTAVYSLGLALTRAGQRDEGQRTLQGAETLRTKGYAVTFGTSYLEQGRYAEAIASTGAEPELVDQTMPRATLTPVALGTTTSGPATPAGADPSPFGRSFSAADLKPDGARRLAASLGGGLTLIDFDGDGDFDLFATFPIGPAGQRLFRNDGGGKWSDVTAASGLDAVVPDSVPIGAVAGDYDNDGMPDLFVLAYGGSRLYHNDGNGRFRDVTSAARLPPYQFLPGAAAFADVDHDGDLDLVIAGLADIGMTLERASRLERASGPMIFPRDFAPAPVQLLRNNGNGTWTDITRDARLQGGTHAIAIVPTDFDNRRDTDLLIVNRDLPPLLFQNMRDGTFRDMAAAMGLAGLVGPAGSNDDVTAVAAGDVNKDDVPDFFFARASGGILALSDRRTRYTLTPAPDGSRSALASQFVDYDNDGLFDLLTWSSDGPHVFRNLGRRWEDVTSGAIAGGVTLREAIPARGLALADVDGDGNTDLVAGSARSLAWWRNSGDDRNHALRVRLKGRVSNRLGIGSKVQMRAGSLSGRLETSATTPAVAAADLVFGLGARAGADVVRLLWPSGILQAEAAGPGEAGAASTLPSSLSIEELDRKPSSCPFLFTWNGHGFEFITDFMGGGEMGYWEGPGQHNRPDPIEYVRIRGDQLQPKSGRFDLRVTNELEETLYADRFELLAIAHPRDIDVFPDEGLTEPPKPFHLYAVRDERVPARVVDDHGHDVTDTVSRIDRRYPDDFALAPFRGYAAQHTLTIDLTGPTPNILLLTAWTDYAFSSDNMAAHQAGLSLSSPSLEIKDSTGAWRTAIADIGIPVGRPQTIVVDLAGRIRPGEHEVRIVTNMRIYWDRILVATSAPADGLRIARIDQQAATLVSRGFSAIVRPDSKEPESYDYQRVTTVSPWKTMPGRYTREGDVHELLARSDDMFVIAKPGDEITLSFDAATVGPLPEGWTRTFLLMADGFSKEMDINSASPDVVEPLPFHAMTQYPYSGHEHYPDTIAHRAYRDKYNTRIVIQTVPTLIAPGGRTTD
jgi:tetratricopeptide (TPR) repeat protein